jgi:flagellar biosynthesis protein
MPVDLHCIRWIHMTDKFNDKTSNEKFKNKTAIALGYNPDDPAPKIIATGKGYLADKILLAADQNKIPVHKDDRLAATLSKLDLGDYIPPELYDIVSEILLFVDNMDRIKSKVMPQKE